MRQSSSESCRDSTNESVEKFLEEIFEACVEEADFTDLIKNLSDLYDSFCGQGFEKCFKHLLMYILSESKRSPDVRRILRFISECVITMDNKYKAAQQPSNNDEEDDAVHPLLKYLFKLLDKWSRASCYTVRYRTCQLLYMILTQIQDYSVGEIDMTTYEMIARIVEERRLDVSCNVRAHTVLLAKFFQDPSTVNDPVIAGLSWQMQHDQNSRVRQNILGIIAACEETIMPIAKRFLYDKHANVRNAALLHICNRITPRSFSTCQRVLILNQCFSDPSELVRRNAEQKLIPVWFRAYGDNLCKFLKELKVGDVSLESLVFIHPLLNILSKCVKISQVLEEIGLDVTSRLPKDDVELTGEKVFLWRHFYGIAVRDDRLTQFVPKADIMIDYIMKYLETSCFEKEKINSSIELTLFLVELLDLNQNFSKSEELFTLILDLTKSPFVSNEIIPYLMALYLRHAPKGKEYVHDDVLGVIKDLQKVLQFTDGEEKNIILKCFVITSELLNTESVLTNSMKNIKDKLIIPNLTSEDKELKQEAITSLAMYCLLDIQEARNSWSFFENSIHIESGALKNILLKGAFDILKCYGPNLFSDAINSGDGQYYDTITHILTNIEVEEDESDIVVQGILKLFLDHHTWSPDLLFKIVLLYFHPEPFYTSQRDIENFLQLYGQDKEEVDCLNKTFLCIVDYLFDANKNSPYHKISIKKTALKLVEFSKRYDNLKNFTIKVTFQDSLMLMLTEKFLKKPWKFSAMDLYSVCNQSISKNLEVLMNLKENVKNVIETLQTSIYQQKNPYSKRCIKNFTAYLKKVKTAINKAPLVNDTIQKSGTKSVQKKLFTDAANDDSSPSERDGIDIEVDSSPFKPNGGSPLLNPPADEIVEAADFEDEVPMSEIRVSSEESDS